MDPLLQHLKDSLADRYQVERQIGAGATATVWVARDLKHERQVAIKVLRPELAAAVGAERFLREIRTAAALQHPHILPVYDSGETDGALYYVMPYVSGESLRERLERDRVLEIGDAVRIAGEVSEALEFAHGNGIVHRDIKPENILLSDGHAVVADFGIARAISSASGDRITEHGVAIGTPIYMSPEQASGEQELDGRTDIYSLGCVLYEMLGGRPPFVGPTTLAVLAHRLTDPPPPLRTLRAEVPRGLELAVYRALAEAPGARYATARAFREALEGKERQPVRFRTAALVTAAVALIAVLAWFARDGQADGGAAALDDSLYLIAPFAHRHGAAPTMISGDQCEQFLRGALRRWSDVSVVPWPVANGALTRTGQPLTLDHALGVARTMGARHLAWGEIAERGDSILVQAYIYDARHPDRPPVSRSVTIADADDMNAASQAFAALADSLLVGRARTSTARASAVNTRSKAAFDRFDAGMDALRGWNLDSASRAFSSAAEIDPEYADAHLWLATTRAWMGSDSLADARGAATAAVRLGARLNPRERSLASALLALGERQYAVACTRLDSLARSDTTDFTAWYALAECLADDPAVVPGVGEPRFRASYESALRAYRRAFSLVPGAHHVFRGPAFSRLAALYFTELYHYRPGVLDGDAASRFAAAPQLIADTIAFVPEPFAQFMGEGSRVDRAARTAAVLRNRDTLRVVTREWVRLFPRSADALSAHAIMLELAGELDGPSAERSALAAVRAARAVVAADTARARSFAVDEVRLLVKLGRWADARSAAESLLASPAPPAPAHAAALAALLGRPSLAARHARRGAGSFTPRDARGRLLTPPTPVAEAALSFLTLAASGAPADAVRGAARDLDRRIESWVAPADRPSIREAVAGRATDFAWPAIPAATVVPQGASYLRRMQSALARRDSAFVRAELASMDSARSAARPGDIGVDALMIETQLRLAVGDSAAAVRVLDAALEALPAQGTRLLAFPEQSAAIPRLMLLRADLASAAGDRAAAARWARPVVELWSAPEPGLVAPRDRARGYLPSNQE